MNETFVPGFFYAPLMSPQRLTVPRWSPRASRGDRPFAAKRGDIAGPQLLGHGLDLLIMMRPAMQLKFLTVTKNRNGSVSSRAVPLMNAPKALRLVLAPHARN